MGFLTSLFSVSATAQVYEWNLKPIFDQPIETSEVWGFEQLQYALRKVPAMPSPSSAGEWTREAGNLRHRLLDNLIFHGWPKNVTDAPPRFEEVGTVLSGKGYQIHKLRYEIVPGLWSTALLYEPENLSGKVPAVMSVLGHYYGKGKAMDFNQELCINYALRGMIALTPEWLDMGELNSPDSSHTEFEPHLDLVGANPVGLFYLAMRRPLDYLYSLPHVDKSRIGITGLSGGGWQTITLSALDPRIDASIPVAGFESVFSALDKMSGPGRTSGIADSEQAPTDFFTILDYSTLAAMRAPRPTLEIYNAEDDCCFRAPLVKPYVYDAVQPFFALYGKTDLFQFYENRDPGTHNYGLHTREQSYRFFDQQFSLSASDREIPVQAEIRAYDELKVGLPQDNLTFLGLAKKLAAEITRPPVPQEAAARKAWAASQRQRLEEVIRYKPVGMKHPWAVANTKDKGVESIAYRFQFSNDLSATGIWINEIPIARDAPITIFLHDQGKQAAVAETSHTVPVISDLLERGHQVYVVDLLFTPLTSKDRHYAPWAYPGALSAFGDRPLGIEAAQLIAIAEWARNLSGGRRVDLLSYGIRDQVIALAVSALKPDLFAQIDIRKGMKSLSYLLDTPVPASDAADLFCQDLYKDFDLDRLAAMAEPTTIRQEYLEAR